MAGPSRVPGSSSLHRDLAVDRLRGVLLILMVAGDHVAGMRGIPAMFQHAEDVGLTLADLVAPVFVFVIGINYGASFARRSRDGVGVAYRHFLTRYLALIGIGAVISAGSTAVAGIPSDWGVLQSLGVAGLVALGVVRLPWWGRFVVGVLVLVAYQYLLDSWALPMVLGSSHGGFIGSLSWAALLILATAVVEVRRRGVPAYLLCCAVLIAVAAVSAVLVPVSKNRVSLSYVLIGLAVGAVVWLLAERLARPAPDRAGLLAWWGERSLALYLLHLPLLGLVRIPSVDWWYAGAPLWLAVVQVAMVVAVMSIAAWVLHYRSRAVAPSADGAADPPGAQSGEQDEEDRELPDREPR